jgi:hypothetical protein
MLKTIWNQNQIQNLMNPYLTNYGQKKVQK